MTQQHNTMGAGVDYLQCTECNHIFDRDEAGERIEIEHDEAEGQRTTLFIHIDTCSKCDSDAVEEYTKCATESCMKEPLLGMDECCNCFAMYSPDDFADYAKMWPEDLPAEYRPSLLA